jgi:hypothetical protein
MGNKKRARFTYYETPDPTRQESRKHQHVSYSTTMDGHLKVSTSFVTTEAPPNLQYTAEEVPDLEENDDDDCEALDPAYLEHLVEMSAEDGFEHQKCCLTAVVCLGFVHDIVSIV